MLVAFELSMPQANSWNGKWSGEGRCYAIVKSYIGAKNEKRAAELCAKGYFHYSWEDGWGAAITVRAVDAAEARKLRSKSVGFAGYEWMVTSILNYGVILADHQVKPWLEKQRAAKAEPVPC